MSIGARCSSVFGRLIAIGKNLGIGRGAVDSFVGLPTARQRNRREASIVQGARMMAGSTEKQERQKMRAMVSFPFPSEQNISPRVWSIHSSIAFPHDAEVVAHCVVSSPCLLEPSACFVQVREFEGKLAVCAKAGDSEGGKDILRKMRDQNLPLSKNAWSMMLKLCHDGRESGLALEIYDEMKSQGVEPAESTYSQLVTLPPSLSPPIHLPPLAWPSLPPFLLPSPPPFLPFSIPPSFPPSLPPSIHPSIPTSLHRTKPTRP